MIYLYSILILVFVLPKWSDGVKVNLQGSVSLGEDVVETLTHYAKQNQLSGRRLLGSGEASDDSHSEGDIVALIVNSVFLCRGIDFCSGDREALVNKYIILLAEAIESVFDALINDADKKQNQNTKRVVIFEKELKEVTQDIKKLLRNVNEKIKEDDDAKFTWIDLIKRINAKFNERAINFALQRLEGNARDISEVMKKLTQQIVIATTAVEQKFESVLCSNHNICTESYECTRALNIILEKIITIPEHKTREFFKQFYEILPSTNFYNKISDVTAREFQFILSDMAYNDNILTTNKILSVLHKSIENRLNIIDSKFKSNSVIGRDVKLVHIILSDMDHFYSRQNEKPFRSFFTEFFEWVNEDGGRISSSIRSVTKDLQDMLSRASNELVLKLTNEVKVFMEITVDPTPN